MNKAAFAPHQIKRSQLQAVKDWVIVTDMAFDQRTTSSGLILLNDNGTGLGIRPRWGCVYATGPDQQDVQVGQWICVAHGRWTRGVEVEDELGEKTLRKIDPKDILLVSDYPPKDDTMSDAVHVAAQQ
jgi:hypothetical protein